MAKSKNSYQLDLFCNSDNLYKITKPIRLIEFFAGIGFQRVGIEKVFPDMQSWKICEWAVPSILAYDIVHSDQKLKDAGVSDAQRFHIYGDGLVVAIPQKIFEKLKP